MWLLSDKCHGDGMQAVGVQGGVETLAVKGLALCHPALAAGRSLPFSGPQLLLI